MFFPSKGTLKGLKKKLYIQMLDPGGPWFTVTNWIATQDQAYKCLMRPFIIASYREFGRWYGPTTCLTRLATPSSGLCKYV